MTAVETAAPTAPEEPTTVGSPGHGASGPALLEARPTGSARAGAAAPTTGSPSTGAAASGTATTTASEAGKVARDSLVLTAGLAMTWGLSLAVRLSLPRFLDASSFGRVVFCESLALLLFTPLTLGMDTYARAEVARQPGLYQRLIRPMAAVRSAVAALLTAGGLGALALMGRPREMLLLFGVYALAQLLLNGATVSSSFLQGGGQTAAATKTQVVTKLTWALVAVSGLAAGGGIVVVPAALAVSEGIRALWLRRRNVALFGPADRSDWPAARLALWACLPFAAQQISISLSNSLDTTLVGVFAGDREVGLYGAATLVASAALFLAPAMSSALLPALSRSHSRGGDDAVCQLGSGVLNVVVAVAGPATTLLALEADELVKRLFGADYLAATGSMRVLSLMFVLTYIASIGTAILVSLRRRWPVTVISIVTVVLNTTINLVFLRPAVHHLGLGGPSLVASWAVFGAEAVAALSLLALLGRRVLNRAFFAVALRTAVACATLAVVHVAIGGNGLGLIALETTAAIAYTTLGALRPIQALRHHTDTDSDERAATAPPPVEEKEHGRAEWER